MFYFRSGERSGTVHTICRYLHNIATVDVGVEQVVALFEEYFDDGKTAYVFTADHGMGNRGRGGYCFAFV